MSIAVFLMEDNLFLCVTFENRQRSENYTLYILHTT